MLTWPVPMRRGNTFYSRVPLRLKLQPLFGKKEVFKSLRTSDTEEAKLLSLKVAPELRKVFAALDKKVKTPDPVVVARDYQHKALADDAAWRLRADPTDDDLEAEAPTDPHRCARAVLARASIAASSPSTPSPQPPGDFQVGQEGRGHGTRAGALPEVHRAPRGADLGEEPGGAGLDVHVHASGAP